MKHTNHVPERTDKPLAERYVSMSNALARSSHGLLLSEKRVVAIALAKTDSKPARDAAQAQFRNGWSVRITAEEYASEFDVSSDTAYNQLYEAHKNLRARFVKTLTQTPRGIKEVLTNWCAQCTYHHGEGWVEISFTTEIAPHLLGLRAKFISYKLKQVSAMRSAYSWRLFECLQSWGSVGRWSPDIDTFHHAMEVPKSLKDFGQMRRRVLDPALKELREKDNLEINLELQKSGRKVTGLVFTYGPNPQAKLDI